MTMPAPLRRHAEGFPDACVRRECGPDPVTRRCPVCERPFYKPIEFQIVEVRVVRVLRDKSPDLLGAA